MTITEQRQPGQRVNVVSRIVRILLFGVTIGTLASFVAIGFVEAIKWLNGWLFVTHHSRQLVPADSGVRDLFFLVPAVGGLIVGLLVRQISDRRPHNPADIIQAVQSRQDVSAKDGLFSGLAALVGMGSGASVGQYGPLAHLGATIGATISRIGKVEPEIGIGCGVAAAISTAFSAPIAGIIFAHEVILRHYSLRAFAPITVASSAGLIIANQVFERPALFEVTVIRSILAPEFFAFILVGVMGALVAVAFMQSVLWARSLSDKLKLAEWMKPAVAGLCVGIAAHWIPEILGIGKETLRFAITPGAYDATELVVILAAKILATALCIGFGFAGGVFSPALLIGVLFGAILGHGAEAIYGEAYSGLEIYAICGMVAVTSPVIGAPLTTILIVFELTRNYELTTAVMVSVAFSNVVAYRLFGRSLFDRMLSIRGIDLSLGRDKVLLMQYGIGKYIRTDFVGGKSDDSLAQVKLAMIEAGRNEAYIVDAASHYIGMINLHQILLLEQERDAAAEKAGDHVTSPSVFFSSELSVWDAMEQVEEFIGESIPVVDQQGILLGVIYESALVKAYLRVVHKLRAEENAAH